MLLPVEFINEKSKFKDYSNELVEIIKDIIRSELKVRPRINRVYDIMETLKTLPHVGFVYLYKKLFGVEPGEDYITAFKQMLYELCEQLSTGKLKYEKDLQDSVMIFFASYGFENVNVNNTLEQNIINIMTIPWVRHNFIISKSCSAENYKALVLVYFNIKESDKYETFIKYNQSIVSLPAYMKAEMAAKITGFMFQKTKYRVYDLSKIVIPESHSGESYGCKCPGCTATIREIKNIAKKAGLEIKMIS